MGKLALAAKITHVPSMYLSELKGEHKGCRELVVDTIVVFDMHHMIYVAFKVICRQ